MSSLLHRVVQPSGHSLRFAAPLLAQVHEHAREGYPHEIVGVLAGDRDTGQVRAVARLVNTNTERAGDRYQVHPLAQYRVEQALEAQGLQVLGYYHSHPDHPAMYSDTDRDLALPNMAYLITSVRGPAPVRIDGDRCWRLREDRSQMDEDTLLPSPPAPSPAEPA